MNKKQTTTSGLEWTIMWGLSQRLKHDKHHRDYLLITIGCYFGLRITDLLSLRWEDLLEKDKFILSEQKTNKPRRITINPRVTEAVNYCYHQMKAVNHHYPNGYIFSNRWGSPVTVSYINKRLKVIFTKYNISVKNASSHTLRKTFGKRIYEADGKSERALVYLSEIFSHSSIAITRRYIGITDEQIADVYLSL